ncbi:MAG: UDP-3-O-(3-hydroxymyristoyl)glucosamine N-acyltransferase [Fibrobacteres bacterium]|nr:UDP-3-O-(3-hydroxymyristoyl)glucosamine N-acyltransferase [Fibrobacterota bacterium]
MSYTLKQIINATGATCAGQYDETLVINGTATLEAAAVGDISFLSNPKYASAAKETSASAVILSKTIEGLKAVQLVTANPYLAWAKICELFAPDRSAHLPANISQTASVHATAIIGTGCHIGHGVCIGASVKIGNRCIIHSGAVIEENCTIGDDTEVHPNVVVHYGTSIGKRCVIWSNAVIGSYGFGYAQDGARFVRIHQLGRVILEDDVDIGACTTIDRGAAGDTVIKRGAKIDNLVQIAHNVQIGEDSAIAAQAGLAGSLKIGDRVKVAGQAGFVGHIEIGNDSFIGAKAGIAKSFPEKSNITGYPARDFMDQRRLEASLLKVPDLIKRVSELENQMKSKES